LIPSCGSSVGNITVNYGASAAAPDASQREGYAFKGWFLDEEPEYEFDFGAVVSGDLQLYAAGGGCNGNASIAGIAAMAGIVVYSNRSKKYKRKSRQIIIKVPVTFPAQTLNSQQNYLIL